MFVFTAVDSAEASANSILAKGLAVTAGSSATAKLVVVANNVIKMLTTAVFIDLSMSRVYHVYSPLILIDIAELDFYDQSFLTNIYIITLLF